MNSSSQILLSAASGALLCAQLGGAPAAERPNILWLTTEDHGPHLGAYGDAYAHTPAMDAFAARSLRYDAAWSNAPVCAPARTAIITGVYPTSTGGQHMRSDTRLPSFLKKYPLLLREAGYYCTNNFKEDYNVSAEENVWDESSRNAHYRNRKEGQPFFAVFNFHDSHESQLRNRTGLPHHDPAEAPLPPYHPDTKEVRRDWAEYYNGVTNADARVGEALRELEEAGLADSTIVFVYSDHGSGMPRHKRWPYNSGLQVPFMVHVPEKYRHLAPAGYRPGGQTPRPVGFVDLAPTLLSLAGIDAPAWMQGQALMGPAQAEASPYLFGFRGRMDERYDMVRSVRNDRYVYIRNYLPHLIYGQYLAYMFQTETTRVWQRLYREGRLTPPQTWFWEPKPAEELYDLEEDPHEINNLAGSPKHQEILAELKEALRRHVMEIRDAGFLPEAEMHRRAEGTTVYEMAQDEEAYPLERIFEMAELAAGRDLGALPRLTQALVDTDPAARYWAVTGIRIRGASAFEGTADRMRTCLEDDNPSVRIAAAELLVKHGSEADISRAVDVLMALAPPDKNGAYTAMAAMNVIADLDEGRLERLKPVLKAMPLKDPNAPARPNDYVRRHVAAVLGEE